MEALARPNRMYAHTKKHFFSHRNISFFFKIKKRVPNQKKFSILQMKYAELYFEQQEFIVRINPVDIVGVSLPPTQLGLFSEKLTLLMLFNAFFPKRRGEEFKPQGEKKHTNIYKGHNRSER